MALVLSLRTGHDFYVDGQRVVTSWIDSPYRFGLKLPSGLSVTLTDDVWVEVFPGVKMQAGTPRNQDVKSLVRVVIDAPGIEIVRGELYRKGSSAVVSNSNCETCKGTKVLSNYEQCPKCHGDGCSSCSKGKIRVEFVCPDCTI